MKLVIVFTNLFALSLLWINLLFFPFACQAYSDLDSLWAEDLPPIIEIDMPVNIQELSNFGIFFVYILIIIGGMFAMAIIFIGGIKMFLASGNNDVHHSASQAFIAGIISLVVAVTLYLSLDDILVIVKELALNMV